MATFFTRRGDGGDTGLLGEGRVPKFDLRMEALGAIDEANSIFGLCRSMVKSPLLPSILLQVQRDLYQLMAEVAATPENTDRFRAIRLQNVGWLEAQMDALSQVVEIPKEFIIPGDQMSSAWLDLARTVVRRAERRVVELFARGDIENWDIEKYLNRLSSLCFVMELVENRAAGSDNPTLAKDSGL